MSQIGKIKVVVNNQSLGPINVKQGNQAQQSKVHTINYGQPLEIGRAIDLDKRNANTGEAIVYNAETNTFDIAPVTANSVTHVYGGTF